MSSWTKFYIFWTLSFFRNRKAKQVNVFNNRTSVVKCFRLSGFLRFYASSIPFVRSSQLSFCSLSTCTCTFTVPVHCTQGPCKNWKKTCEHKKYDRFDVAFKKTSWHDHRHDSREGKDDANTESWREGFTVSGSCLSFDRVWDCSKKHGTWLLGPNRTNSSFVLYSMKLRASKLEFGRFELWVFGFDWCGFYNKTRVEKWLK